MSRTRDNNYNFKKKKLKLQNQYQVHVDVTLLWQNNATETRYNTQNQGFTIDSICILI